MRRAGYWKERRMNLTDSQRERVRESKRAYYSRSENRERENAQRRVRRSSPEARVKLNAQLRAQRAKYPEKVREQVREWKKTHRAIANSLEAERRAAKFQRTPAWADRAAIREYYQIAALLTRETGKQYHVDHIIPLRGKNVSGLHIASNMRVILAIDNIRKGNRYE